MSNGLSPLVSVLMITYNHESFIDEAIQSVLNQSFRDLELIVVNDGSTDGTRERIQSIRDPRLVWIDQVNQGPSIALNRGMESCRGRYVALMSGDDVCRPQRIEQQFTAYQAGGRRVLFGQVDFIDDQSQPINGPHFASTLFEEQPLSRAETLHRFFDQGNFLNAVTAFTERAVFQEAGPFDPVLFQLQDFDMWVRLVKQYELAVMPCKLMNYRIRSGGENLSSPKADHMLRSLNEMHLVWRRFFEHTSVELFRQAFRANLIDDACATELDCACEQAFLFFNASSPEKRLIGLEKLHELLNDPSAAEVLRYRYHFAAADLARHLQTMDLWNRFVGQESVLFLDTGNGWRADRCISKPVDLGLPDFSLTYDLAHQPPLQSLRWDPMEHRLCRVRISAISFRDSAGKVYALDPDSIQSNGHRLPDGTVVFETPDPQFVLPINGAIDRLTIQGQWQSIEPARSVQDLHQRLEETKQQLHELRQLLRDQEQHLQSLLSSHSWRVTAPLRYASRFMKSNTGAV